jgi:hypothetical protein
MTFDPQDHHVLTVVGVDMTKDRALAEGVLDGTVNKFSMGCICASVICTYCNKEAFSDRDLCEHLLWYKMAKINGKLVFEKCRGVEFQELSAVHNPADPKAITQALLKYAARQVDANNIRASFNVLSSLVSKDDAHEVARFFQMNTGKLPEAMLRLADKLL